MARSGAVACKSSPAKAQQPPAAQLQQQTADGRPERETDGLRRALDADGSAEHPSGHGGGDQVAGQQQVGCLSTS